MTATVVSTRSSASTSTDILAPRSGSFSATRAPRQAAISASDIEAQRRFGFLSIGIDEGSLTDYEGPGPAHVTRWP